MLFSVCGYINRAGWKTDSTRHGEQMKKKSSIVCIFALFAAGAAFASDVKLTEEQCEDFAVMETLRLSEANKKAVLDSCKERYSSENALGNCTAFEGEDYLKMLKKLAKKQCKKQIKEHEEYMKD